MAVNSINLENADLELLSEAEFSNLSSTSEFPENSQLSPKNRENESPTNNNNNTNVHSNCCICITPLLLLESESLSSPNCQPPNSFSYFDVIEEEKLIKILDISNSLRTENDEKITYPICKPCYIEIVKYEKLQTEKQRIVDQIVSTVMENLEFQESEEENDVGESETAYQTSNNHNPLESLKHLIFERWKPQIYQPNHIQEEEEEDQQFIIKDSSTSTSSSILKAIFQALNLQPQEIIPDQVNRTLEDFSIIPSSSLDQDQTNSGAVVDIRVESVEEDSILSLNENQYGESNDRRPLDSSNSILCSTIISHNDNSVEGSGKESLVDEDSSENLGSKNVPEIDMKDDDEEDATDGSLKSHTDRRGPFICTLCKKEFRQQRDLDVHIRRQHTGERPFICETCGKTYPAKSALHHHRKIHSQRFVCELCGTCVVTETGLKKHMQIHQGVKQFCCEICSKSFMWKQSLLKHQMLHTNDKPHSCKICQKSYAIKDYLDKHISRRHPEKLEGHVVFLECPYCESAKFLHSGNLSAHILRKHSSASASFV